MPHFIINSPSTNSSSNWVPVPAFKSLNRIVEDSGVEKSANTYSGRYYQIVRKEIYIFEGFEYVLRKVVAFAALTFSAGLLWLYKPVRDLWEKDHLSRRYGTLYEETPIEEEGTTPLPLPEAEAPIVYDHPTLLTDGIILNESYFNFIEVQKGDKMTLLLVVSEDGEKFREFTEFQQVVLFKIAKKSLNSILPVVSKLANPNHFFNFLLGNGKLFKLHPTHILEICNFFIQRGYPLSSKALVKLYDYAKLNDGELKELIEARYPNYKNALDPAAVLPTEIMVQIFSYMKKFDYRSIRLVSQEWSKCSFDINRFKNQIYENQVISAARWAVKTGTRMAPGGASELRSLDEHILSCYISCARQVKEKLVLVRDLSSFSDEFKNLFAETIKESIVFETTVDSIKWIMMPQAVFDQKVREFQLKNAEPEEVYQSRPSSSQQEEFEFWYLQPGYGTWMA